MKQLPSEAVEALAGTNPIIAGAAKFAFESQDYFLASGYGEIEIEGDTYTGVGARALIVPLSSQIGGAADSLVITLSALDPEIAETVESEGYHQKPVVIRRVIFGPDRQTILGSGVFKRGRCDHVAQRESVGGTAALDFVIEGPRLDMNRAGGRIRADADQRTLGGSGDAAAKHISVAGRKTLRWGQKDTASPFGRGALPLIRPQFASLA